MKRHLLLLTVFILFITSSTLKAGTDTTVCNWMSRIFYFNTWDTCQGAGKTNNINAAIILKGNTGCYKYAWSVNGNVVSTTNLASYKITANGTYNFCLKVIDTCNKCDTSVCISKTFTCFSCNWKATRDPKFVVKDSCRNSVPGIKVSTSIKGSSSCLKLQVTVNGVLKSTRYADYIALPQNGSYTVCVKLIDSCNKCDTSLCVTRTVNCPTKCNWSARSPVLVLYDSCSVTTSLPAAIKGYLSMQAFSCMKVTWTVNSSVVQVFNGKFIKNLSQNGTYNVCVKIQDTCKNCDTTICRTIVVNCTKNCSWSARMPQLGIWDTCKGPGFRNSLNANVSFQNSGTGCFRYAWRVNGIYAGDKSSMSYETPVNGTYLACVKITDTCNNCDTTICFTRNVSCYAVCNWKARVPYFFAWDTCKGTGFRNSVNAYISFQNGYDTCYKYAWTVNGVSAGSKNVMNYPVTKNGTYTICLKIIDTCGKCDTTFCTTKTLSCFAGCSWKTRLPTLMAWDSCKGSNSTLNAYVSVNNRSCLTYKWKVNGVAKTGNGFYLSYPVTQNGSYTVCVTLIDSCTKCDTTVCITKTITCFSNPCNFKSRGAIFSTWDSCKAKQADLLGYMFFTNSKCLKYQWKVGSTVVSNLQSMNYAVTKNGTYTICLKVIDTCNQCDTVFCVTKVVKCSTLGMETQGVLSPSVYPNPAGDIVSIDWPGALSRFALVNMLGSVVAEGNLEEGNNTVNTSSISSGVYTLKVYTLEGIVTAKLVIQR